MTAMGRMYSLMLSFCIETRLFQLHFRPWRFVAIFKKKMLYPYSKLIASASPSSRIPSPSFGEDMQCRSDMQVDLSHWLLPPAAGELLAQRSAIDILCLQWTLHNFVNAGQSKQERYGNCTAERWMGLTFESISDFQMCTYSVMQSIVSQ